MEVPS